MEVQVEDGFLAAGQPAADHLLVQGGEELLLAGVGEPVAVAGERGFLRQHGHPGEQRGCGVGQQVIDVGGPPGAGQLERKQGQQPADRGDDAGAGVAGRGHQGGQVQGHQVGDGQQQPRPGRVQPPRPGGEVQHLRSGQVRVPARGRRADTGLRLWPAQQPAEPLLGEDLRDGCAVQRGALPGQPGGDLVAGQPLPAQPDHPAADPLFGRGRPRRRPGLARRGEQLQLPRPPVADQVDHRPPGVAEPGRGLLIRQALGEVGAQRLIPSLVHLLRGGKPLLPGMLPRSGCHMGIMPYQLPRGGRPQAARIMPAPARMSRTVPRQARQTGQPAASSRMHNK